MLVILRRVLVDNFLRGGGSGGDQGCRRCSSKRMSKERNETPICHCGQRYVMRTANTTKNRGKHFWGCSKYKNGVQDVGCNFFKWCTDVESKDNGRYVKSEGNKETLVNSEELESMNGFYGLRASNEQVDHKNMSKRIRNWTLFGQVDKERTMAYISSTFAIGNKLCQLESIQVLPNTRNHEFISHKKETVIWLTEGRICQTDLELKLS
ncbi:hypothetical protein V8G54_033485 [Vigna mungo]|uniref:GRF-type domain-containing protein n=1 Tax=Vigna mungo TaxID=3915 RepID=A0AAQ3MNF2_VIGMU